MRRIQKGKNKSLKKLKAEYYKLLNRDKSKNSRYIEGRIDDVYHKSVGDEKEFWDEFRKNGYKLLKKVCMGTPAELNWLKKHIGALIDSYNLGPLYEFNSKKKVVSTAFGERISYVFNYEGFRSSRKSKWLCDELDINICPYCNLEKLDRPSDGKLLFDLDHYFSKVRYPYFRLSFYNLIPSCHKCNRSYKTTIDFSLKKYTHPYRDDFNSGYEFKLNRFPNNENDFSFEIILKQKGAKKRLLHRCKNHSLDLGIETRYQEYKEHVMSVYNIYCEHPETKIDELYNLSISGHRVFNSKEMTQKRMLDCGQIPLSEEFINKKVAGKLKWDIASYFQLNRRI